MAKVYNHKEIEVKWQQYWEQQKTFMTPTLGSRPKYYVLDMFPYPSGQGLHVGHPKGYVGSDVIARYKRMQGYDVLHPMGWDAFGLPTERQAAKEGIHPAVVTQRNTDTFRQQLKKLGLNYDWSREICTSDPSYYKWTQWIFLKLYEQGLAYQAEVPVNWCPALGTVLANEEVKDGVYVETGDPVERRLMKQWMLRITAYADRLLNDLDLVDWPESLKEMQRNWIGRSEGARIRFPVAHHSSSFEVFSTRPDTLFACTYCVLAPEHPLVSEITTEAQKQAVSNYVEQTSRLSERERIAQAEIKSGVFTGAYAVCPVNGQLIPIWIADYVLLSYGTGAVFGCPAHDERDYAFAKRFGLPILEVVSGGDIQKKAYTGDGAHINSGFLDDLNNETAKKRIITWLQKHGCGEAQVTYRLRDWLFSRQRYWGEPIPVLFREDGIVTPVPEDQLPVVLPHLDEITPTPDGQPPLARAEDWLHTIDPRSGKPALRETNTMPQWAGSCWYYLRFIDPNNSEEPWSKEAEQHWMPVDLYVGGAEHATLHLLYARFWHKVLYDIGYVSTPEPFHKLFNQGMILSRSFRDVRGKYYYPYEAIEKDGGWFLSSTGEPLETKIEKMSKSKCNVVTPDEVIEEYGADSLRLYEMFLGPLEEEALWQTDQILGVRRFLERTWRLFFEKRYSSGSSTFQQSDEELEILLHKTIKKATEDIESLRFNTAISHLMSFVNEATKRSYVSDTTLSILVRLLAPFAPHIAEELWEYLGNEDSITYAPWPQYDQEKIIEESVNIAVQVSGKLRSVVEVARGSTEEVVKEIALQTPQVANHLQGKSIVKTIFVPDKLINFVVKGT
ncbi:leucine--tRNA ligase [Fischerella sp. PCC 9605]|uniref:leucine--tRNA ligase n=1 Tax=Fischerella sp. PCC 9605 TaxID=1173024 RepID=UPI00047CEBD3|nr:leucine--tRNA ligase [Fischerella sp. PCC 9605]